MREVDIAFADSGTGGYIRYELISMGEAWVKVRNGYGDEVHFPVHRIHSIKEVKEEVQPTERRVSWDELRARG